MPPKTSDITRINHDNYGPLEEETARRARRVVAGYAESPEPVSYTHLTLPTKA